MGAANEMIKSLGDKYTRLLDRYSYAVIQRFGLIGVGSTLMLDSQTKRLMVGAPLVQGSSANLRGVKAGDYIMAVNGVNTEGRTVFDIIDQISDRSKSTFITMNIRNATSSTNGNAPSSSNNDFFHDITMRR